LVRGDEWRILWGLAFMEYPETLFDSVFLKADGAGDLEEK
jgi:hypothetical protein